MEQLRAPKHVVIVGAGFGGVYAYLELHRKLHGTGRIEVTIINPNDYFVFTPLIHEVATGSLLPLGVTQSLMMLPRCCIDRFILGNATRVDYDRQVVHVHLSGTPGDPTVPADDFAEVQYDYLVLAMGSETNFFDVLGAKEYALELNDIVHARKLKNHILERFEHAQTLRDPKDQRRELSFIIVGGGPTGVEIAGELADFLYGVVASAFPRLSEYARILVLEREDKLLKHGVDEWFSRKATDILMHKKGVYVLYDLAAREVTPDGVVTERGFVYGKTVVWAAGVVARSIAFSDEKGVECEDHRGRIRVNDFLQVPQHKNIFVVGDQAWVCDQEREGAYPMRAQFAVREGKHAAKNIVSLMNDKPLKSFSFREKGMIISLGRGGALARLFGMRFSGHIAWFVYRLAYLTSMIGWRIRLRTALEWLLNIFLPRDISRI